MHRSELNSPRATHIALILAFALSAILFTADRTSEGFLEREKMGIGSTVSPILSTLSSPIRALESFTAQFIDRNRAFAENKALKEELYVLREAKERSDIVAMKLARFEQILGSDFGVDVVENKIAARAVSEIDGPFVRSALINAGQKKGVGAGHAVMTVDGLYGHVLRVGANSSRVLRLEDLNSRLAVMSSASGATAILAGDNTDQPVLTFASDPSKWKIGSKVITSGDGGVLPRGLPVGTVASGGPQRLVVDLNITGRPVDWVWVLPFTPIAPPEADPILSEGNPQITEAINANAQDAP